MKKPFCPITADNQFVSLEALNDDYLRWLHSQDNPPKSYLNHPFESADALVAYKKAFQKQYAISLGAYLRQKRVYFLLNHTQTGEQTLLFSYLTTPIGLMLAVSTAKGLVLLEFADRKMLETELNEIIRAKKARFQFDEHAHSALQTQLTAYFDGKRKAFDYPLDWLGTTFQQQVWQALLNVPYGETASYSEQAEKLNQPTAIRAVASANGKNKISILVPCHRVIQKNGDLGGYGGGIDRKRFLLALEQASG